MPVNCMHCGQPVQGRKGKRHCSRDHQLKAVNMRRSREIHADTLALVRASPFKVKRTSKRYVYYVPIHGSWIGWQLIRLPRTLVELEKP